MPRSICMHYFDPIPILDLWKLKSLLEIRFPLPSLSCALRNANYCRPLHYVLYGCSTQPLSRFPKSGHSWPQFAAVLEVTPLVLRVSSAMLGQLTQLN